MTLLVTLIATKFAGGTDICDAAANQITRTFGQLELIIVVSSLGFSELDPSWPQLTSWVNILTFRLTFFRKRIVDKYFWLLRWLFIVWSLLKYRSLIGPSKSRGEPTLTSLRDSELWTFENLKVDCWVFVKFHFLYISGTSGLTPVISHFRSHHRKRFTSGSLRVNFRFVANRCREAFYGLTKS